MVDLLAIGQGLGALKAASDIAKTLVGLRDSAQLLEKSVELNRKILDAQGALTEARSEQTAMIEQIRTLEEEIARLKSWETEKQRYELKRYLPGVLFYTLKQEGAGGEPVHALCAKCYHDGKKAIVQRTGKTTARDPTHFCPQCRTEYYVWLRSDVDI